MGMLVILMCRWISLILFVSFRVQYDASCGTRATVRCIRRHQRVSRAPRAKLPQRLDLALRPLSRGSEAKKKGKKTGEKKREDSVWATAP